MLYGDTPVRGEVWECPLEMLARLDAYEGTAASLFRRVALEVEGDEGPIPCWLYVAGPALSKKLTPARRLERQS